MQKINELKTVSRYGGIQLGDSPDWINPAKEKKDKILENLEKIRGWVGKQVIVEMADERTYSGIGISKEERETGTSPIPTLNKELTATGTKLLSKEHIINLQGKEFVTHAGLLEVAHKIGLKSIITEFVKTEEPVMCKAVVTLSSGAVFEAHGDASSESVNKMIQPHIIRMAETRAVNRALRFATNIGMCSAEELGGNDKEEPVE